MSRKKKDKLFDNNYGESDFVPESNQSFQIEDGFGSSDDPELDIHEDIIFREIDKIIVGSQFKYLLELDENNKEKKLNKSQINQVYKFVIDKIGDRFKHIDIWGSLSKYFNIYANKFYSSLSNVFKHKLETELEELT
jgi:hypothetical protein